YLELFRAATAKREPFDQAMLFAIRGVLVSSQFLFRLEPPNPTAQVRPIDQYALASRLSYFLWGSMPDELLFDIAAAGKLYEPGVLRALSARTHRQRRAA